MVYFKVIFWLLLEESEENKSKSVKIASNLTKIQSRHLPNTSLGLPQHKTLQLIAHRSFNEVVIQHDHEWCQKVIQMEVVKV